MKASPSLAALAAMWSEACTRADAARPKQGPAAGERLPWGRRWAPAWLARRPLFALACVAANYSNLERDALLDHPARRRLAALITLEPGASPPQLHRVVGGGWSTVVYHLRVLERNGLVTSLRDGRHRRFFPADGTSLPRQAATGTLQRPSTRRVLDLILHRPGIHQSMLARRLQQSHATVQWHLRRLQQAGLVRAERRGSRVEYYAM